MIDNDNISSVKKNMWIIHAMLAGLGFGVGNFFYASLSSKGFIAISFVGLISFVIIVIYRAY